MAWPRWMLLLGLLGLLVRPSRQLLSLSDRFSRDGHAVARGLLSPAELAAARPLFYAAIARERAFCSACAPPDLQDLQHACFPCDHSFRDERPGNNFNRSRSLALREPALAGLLLRHAGLAAAAAAALGHPRALRLYQATAFLKAPGSGPTIWHQDAAAMPLEDGARTVTLWLALEDAPPACGPLRFLSASHLPGVPLPSLRGLHPSRRMAAFGPWEDAALAAAAGGLRIAEPRRLRAGDGTLHAGWTLHAAGGNACNHTRAALALTYFADGARVHPQLFGRRGGGAGRGAAGFRLPRAGSGGAGAPRLLASTITSGEDRQGVRVSSVAAAAAAAGEGEGEGEEAAEAQVLRVRVLADDVGTWAPWLLAQPPMLIPGRPADVEALVPVVYRRGGDDAGL